MKNWDIYIWWELKGVPCVDDAGLFRFNEIVNVGFVALMDLI